MYNDGVTTVDDALERYITVVVSLRVCWCSRVVNFTRIYFNDSQYPYIENSRFKEQTFQQLR